MRPHILRLALTATLCCGCGNWSNEDLAFLSALPTREALESRLPSAGQNESGLTGTHREGLSAVGERASYYDASVQEARQFNALIETLLHLIDSVRAQAPTSRTAGRRVWGPFPDARNRRVEVRATMDSLAPAHFLFRVELRPRGAAEWTVTMEGEFFAAEQLQRGRGHLRLDADAARAVGAGSPDLEALSVLSVSYQTDASPSKVQLDLELTEGNPQGISALGYTAHQTDEGAVAIRFVLDNPTSAQLRRVEVVSRWREDGAGRADTRVLEGTYQDAGETECWDAQFQVTFAEQRWLGGARLGDAATCVAVPDLE